MGSIAVWMTRRTFDLVLFDGAGDLVLFDGARFAAILGARFAPALLRFEEPFLRVAVRFFDLAMTASLYRSEIPPRSSTLTKSSDDSPPCSTGRSELAEDKIDLAR